MKVLSNRIPGPMCSVMIIIACSVRGCLNALQEPFRGSLGLLSWEDWVPAETPSAQRVLGRSPADIPVPS